MKTHPLISMFLVAVLQCGVAAAKEPVPQGLIAASCGDEVVLVDPASGATAAYSTGPVGWLYPAPGGVLFAPDLVHGRTTVIDLTTRQVKGQMDGITMPHFGTSPDRYVVVAQQVLLVSYPERATIARVDAELAHPWQVIISPDEVIVIVLDRHPQGVGDTNLVAVDLVRQEVIFRQPVDGDVVSVTLLQWAGVLALADRDGNRVRLVEPATLATLQEYPVEGELRDVVAVTELQTLAVAAATDADHGRLELWRIKSGKQGLRRKEPEVLSLDGPPVRLAVAPEGAYVAAALATSRIQVVQTKGLRSVATIDVPAIPRDVVWCDLEREGPLLPDWSDEKPPELTIE
jgi:hypothetical protein